MLFFPPSAKSPAERKKNQLKNPTKQQKTPQKNPKKTNQQKKNPKKPPSQTKQNKTQTQKNPKTNNKPTKSNKRYFSSERGLPAQPCWLGWKQTLLLIPVSPAGTAHWRPGSPGAHTVNAVLIHRKSGGFNYRGRQI